MSFRQELTTIQQALAPSREERYLEFLRLVKQACRARAAEGYNATSLNIRTMDSFMALEPATRAGIQARLIADLEGCSVDMDSPASTLIVCWDKEYPAK